MAILKHYFNLTDEELNDFKEFCGELGINLLFDVEFIFPKENNEEVKNGKPSKIR